MKLSAPKRTRRADTKPNHPGLKTDDDADPHAVLAALEDEACRAILEATAEESLTATELSEKCDIPTSTMYRKVELLTDAGLVDERIRINTTGKHATEYRKRFEDITVAIVEGGEIDVRITEIETEADAAGAASALGL
ncbi:helix-turn-helix domain-containing protein [Natrialbaceae archaeon GCM10025810]|uniref:helix-turn-helix domain-containing protein n=1 Tax=Halovalidus salilacus TaxID=3075124 RepID=UPI003616B9A3